MMYMLDTDTASYLIKGKSPTIEAKLETLMPSAVSISVMTWAELQYGLKRLPADHRLRVAVCQFLKIVHTLSWDSEAADWYAKIRHQLVGTGKPIGEMDMMIAACALRLLPSCQNLTPGELNQRFLSCDNVSVACCEKRLESQYPRGVCGFHVKRLFIKPGPPLAIKKIRW